MSPGRLNPGSDANARLAARPMPVSNMPPHQTGTELDKQMSWTARASNRPPTRPGLMFTIEHAPTAMAVAALWAETIDSSRQTAVEIPRESSRVAEEILLVQRLFDQQEAEWIELGEVIEVGAPIRAVGVHLQHQAVSESVPNGRDWL